MTRSRLASVLAVVVVLTSAVTPIRAQSPGATPAPKAILESLERAFVSVAEQVMPAVVHIEATLKEPARLVSDVNEDGPAARAEIRAGDVILEANRRQLRDVKAFEEALGPGDRDVLLFLQREGRSIYAVMKPEPRGGGQ